MFEQAYKQYTNDTLVKMKIEILKKEKNKKKLHLR